MGQTAQRCCGMSDFITNDNCDVEEKNSLLTELSITDTSNCDLNDKNFRKEKLNAISKLNQCLREFRDIFSFDR